MKKYAVGVDLGGTNIRTALIDLKYDIIKQLKISTEANRGPGYVISRIIRSIHEVIKNSPLKYKQIVGVGIGAPGPLDAEKGIIHFAPNLPGWKNTHLKEKVQKIINLPVYVDNDANLAAFGEATVGAGKGVKNLICITLGTGVGGGLILNGELYHGTEDAAGEIGHMIVEPDGAKCNCGNSGCLEVYSSATGIVNRIRLAIKNGEKTVLKEPISSKKVHQSALKGDKLSQRIMFEAGKYLGIALVNVANLLNLEMAIIGGNVADAGEIILGPVRKEISKRALYPSNKMKVVSSKLSVNAGIIGAARLAMLKS